MDLEESARQSGVIPPERVASLIAALRKVPDFSWLLTQPHPTIERLQADLLVDFPVALVAPDGAPRCKPFVVLIVNNTCDLQPGRSNFVTVAPVLDFEAFAAAEIAKRGEEGARDYLRDIRSNRVFEMLWLPPFHHFKGGGIVFLDRLGSAAGEIYLRSLEANSRVASFSQNGFYYFLIKMTNHLARAESSEVQRHNLN
jgi:hypothetical protein